MGQVFGSKKKAARIAALDGEICETKKGPKSRSKMEREGSSGSLGADAAGSTGKGISSAKISTSSSSSTANVTTALCESSATSLTSLRGEIVDTFGESIANQMLSPKWDNRETALRRIASAVSATNALLTCGILENSCNDKVFSVILASHECFLRVLQLQVERARCLDLVISSILPKSWVQAPKVAKSAKLVVRYFVENFPDATSDLIKELYNQAEDVSRRATVCLGALEVLDLVLQGDKVAKKFEDAKEACIDLLRLGFQDGLGPKIRFRATTVVNRIRDVVHEDELEPLFRDLRPAVVSQINRARSSQAEPESQQQAHLSVTNAHHVVVGVKQAMNGKNKNNIKYLADIDGDELLMDAILDEAGIVFQKSDRVSGDDSSTSVGGSTRDSFGLRSADLLT
ncbi:unnamed protein product [Amoebophrya sp. A120]|nr:unnamed protein product [Amoebophrya sp. A120]|eukprot:GSA120T00015110001.1